MLTRRFKGWLCFVAVILLGLPLCLHSQNLMLNPGFEELNNCREHHADCAMEAWFNIPAVPPRINMRWAPRPMLGHNMLVLNMENLIRPIKLRSYIYTVLPCRLEAGETYLLDFFLYTGKLPFDRLDFSFLSSEPTLDGLLAKKPVPSFTLNPSHIQAEMKGGWKAMETTYIAHGTERFLLLGNLSDQPMLYPLEKAMDNQGDVFYFLDEMQFKKLEGTSVCPDYDTIKKQVYAQNLRHTENVQVFPFVPEPPPVWITDSITLPSVLFETNQSVIRPGFSSQLDSLAEQWKEKRILQVQITGHTDAIGRPIDNRLLSQNRANAVKAYLLNRLPALSEKITAIGLGADQPVADNRTSDGRTSNRRVVIRVTYTQSNSKTNR